MIVSASYKDTINAAGTQITILSSGNEDDFISLTDIAKYRTNESPGYTIQNWMRNRNTIKFLGLWETLNNPNFNYLEFEAIESEAGLNSFVLTPKRWIESTSAVGMTSTQGRYASTFAHKDIAFEFASWLSPEFKLYIIKDYQRLKEDENGRLSLNWNLRRELTKINYRIHTDAVKDHLIPDDLPDNYKNFSYANEADLLNVAMFGVTAKEWKKHNPNKKGNIRDDATMDQLLVLANLESYNAQMIRSGIPQNQRLVTLHEAARDQMRSIANSRSMERLRAKGIKQIKD